MCPVLALDLGTNTQFFCGVGGGLSVVADVVIVIHSSHHITNSQNLASFARTRCTRALALSDVCLCVFLSRARAAIHARFYVVYICCTLYICIAICPARKIARERSRAQTHSKSARIYARKQATFMPPVHNKSTRTTRENRGNREEKKNTQAMAESRSNTNKTLPALFHGGLLFSSI